MWIGLCLGFLPPKQTECQPTTTLPSQGATDKWSPFKSSFRKFHTDRQSFGAPVVWGMSLEDKMVRRRELKEKSRKRKRGPYRKASSGKLIRY